jgi:phospholipid/cholesterol/gamma-HCH transport system substrate-binding protein
VIARGAALAALLLALVLVGMIVLGSGSPYALRADFADAGGIVSGDEVLIGPTIVGSVTGVKLTPDGEAEIALNLHAGAAPMPQGTVARIFEDSLSGIANRYIALDPGPKSALSIPSGGLIDLQHTHSEVNLDQLFNTFDAPTRAGLRGLIQGEATSLQSKGAQANSTLEYLAPGLESTSNLTAELARNQPQFDDLLVQGAQVLQTLAAKASTLTSLVQHTSAAAGAAARQATALEQAIALLPSTLNHSTSTFAGLRTTLNALDPLVTAAKPATRKLAPFARSLKTLAIAAVPTVTKLAGLIRNPARTGDLIELAQAAPALQQLAATAFPRAIQTMDASQNQLDALREYTPDLVAALSDIGQDAAYYDANGHYARSQPDFFQFSLDPARNVLQSVPGFSRLSGVQVVHGRCPGGAMQETADASAPWVVQGCNASASP